MNTKKITFKDLKHSPSDTLEIIKKKAKLVKKLRSCDLYNILFYRDSFSDEVLLSTMKQLLKSADPDGCKVISKNEKILAIARKIAKKNLPEYISCNGDRSFINDLKKENFKLFNPKGRYNGYGYEVLPMAVSISNYYEFIKWQKAMLKHYFGIMSKSEEEKFKKEEENKKILAKKLKDERKNNESYQAMLLERKIKREKIKKVCGEMGIPHDRISTTLYENLKDITEANKEWLQTAYDALDYSISNRGIMADWKNGRLEDDYLSFYDCLRKAITAHRRHTETEYDNLLQRGWSKESAREFIYNNK